MPRYSKITFFELSFYLSSIWSRSKCTHFELDYLKCIGCQQRSLRRPGCREHTSLHGGARRLLHSLPLLHLGKRQTRKLNKQVTEGKACRAPLWMLMRRRGQGAASTFRYYSRHLQPMMPDACRNWVKVAMEPMEP